MQSPFESMQNASSQARQTKISRMTSAELEEFIHGAVLGIQEFLCSRLLVPSARWDFFLGRRRAIKIVLG